MFETEIYSRRWDSGEREELAAVWRVLVTDFFQRFIDPQGTVLDLGAGHCHFINHVRAKRRIALDTNKELPSFCAPGVESIISDDLSLPMIGAGEVSHFFMSNFLEHLADGEAVLRLLRTLHSKLTTGGRVLILQPNFRLVGARYFDFIDHRVILTEKSLVEALRASGFVVRHLQERFLPYTSKSRLPKWPSLVRLYLRLPLAQYLLGEQTFVIGERD